MRLSVHVAAAVILAAVFSVASPPEPAAKQAEQPQATVESSTTTLPDGRELRAGGRIAGDAVATMRIVDGAGRESTVAVLSSPRWGHTATLLPSGAVLVLGGQTGSGAARTAEVFDPQSNTVESAPFSTTIERRNHTSTVLPDGRVLLAGGSDAEGSGITRLDVLDPSTGRITSLSTDLPDARSNHSAQLTPDGRVRLFGGTNQEGTAREFDVLIDPVGMIVVNESASTRTLDDTAAVALAESLPANGAVDVPLDTPIRLRFSHPLRAGTVTQDTVALLTEGGVSVERTVVPVERGMLVFIRPKGHLEPGRRYALVINGAVDSGGTRLPIMQTSFVTSSDREPESTDPEVWTPDPSRGAAGWRTGRGPSKWESLPPLQAPPGVTALSGRVLRLDGLPMPGVTIRIDALRTLTDRTGRFLLQGVEDGHHELVIDGRSASSQGRRYGVFEVGVDITEKRTNVLPYTSWMPRLDGANVVQVTSPLAGDVTITTPHIPGLELRLREGTVIRDIDGVTSKEVGITPIPLDRPPFPLPENVYVPVYFTVQPGGAYLYNPSGRPARAQLVYPNYRNAPTGAIFDFWHYDPKGRGWYVYRGRQKLYPSAGVGAVRRPQTICGRGAPTRRMSAS